MFEHMMNCANGLRGRSLGLKPDAAFFSHLHPTAPAPICVDPTDKERLDRPAFSFTGE